MRHIIIAALLAATWLPPTPVQSQTGTPRYLVKAWIQKFDKSFEHESTWCRSEDICTFKIGEHEVQLLFFLTGDSYRLLVHTDPEDPAPCCIFADGTEEAFISSGDPHAEVLYFRLPAELRAGGRVEFGTIYIAVEDLR